jgi:predicted NACHT family NTPase
LDKDRVLKLQKVFVPLKIVPKEAVQVEPNPIQEVKGEANNPKEKQIWDFLAAMGDDSAFPRMAVLGAPGSGKTTLLRHLTLTYATNIQRKLHPKAPKLIPVLLYLKDVREVITSQQPPSLAELITEQVKQQRKIQPLNPPPDWFADKLLKNRCLVMLDGLDEVADETQRQQVSRWVDKQMQVYPDTSFILTSRPFGYQSARLQQEVSVLEVQPFNLKQMEEFIHNWYLETEVMSRAGEVDIGVREDAEQQAKDLIKRIKNSSPLAAMAVNPLLLTMIATVHRRGNALPGKRVELYKEICHVLLEKRQRAKDIPGPLTATQKQSVLQVLALELMQQNTREFTLSTGIKLIKHKLTMVAGNTANPKDFLEQIKDVSGLLVEKEIEIYEFAHKTFQEYLAAVQVKESNQQNLLIQNINNSWWAETIRLYAAQSNSSNLIRAVLALSSPSIEALALAYDCLEEGLSVDSDVRRQLKEKLDADLESR